MRGIVIMLAALPLLAQTASEWNFLSGQVDGRQMQRMLHEWLVDKAMKQLDERGRAVAKLSSSQDVYTRRKYLRERITRALGGFPERTPLNPRLMGAVEREDYRIERIIFESQPKF